MTLDQLLSILASSSIPGGPPDSFESRFQNGLTINTEVGSWALSLLFTWLDSEAPRESSPDYMVSSF